MVDKLSRSMPEQRVHFPFTAVVTQSQFKLALLLAAISPLVGGVLVSGPRGSAKSTLAKGLADILPEHEGKTRPFITLPLGATEEMLIGTLNLQQVLEEHCVEFQAGLLAKAHDGVLYVDEVNLLPDNLVDQLLDVAASGMNIIERDGISHQHAAQFILLGTMNPDEGELRPQLVDRFGLSVTLSNQYSIEERMQVVKLRESFDKNPLAFVAEYADKQQALKKKIAAARQFLSSVICDDPCRQLIAEKCTQARVDGLRADIVWTQAAIAHASLEQHSTVNEADVCAVEALVLHHRRNDSDNQGRYNDNAANMSSNTSQPPKSFSRPTPKANQQQGTEQQNQQHDAGDQQNETQEVLQGDWGAMQADAEHQALEKIAPLNLPTGKQGLSFQSQKAKASMFTRDKGRGGAQGRQSSALTSNKVNWFSTFLTNAHKPRLERLQFFNKKQGHVIVHLVLLDTSASLLTHQAFAKSKGLILQIAKSTYLQRQQFAIIGFGNQQVNTLLGLRRAPKAIEEFLNTITAAGGTPLMAALNQAEAFQRQLLRKNEHVQFRNTIITDGRVSHLDFSGQLQGDVVVIDVEPSAVKRGKSRQLAELLRGQYVPLMV